MRPGVHGELTMREVVCLVQLFVQTLQRMPIKLMLNNLIKIRKLIQVACMHTPSITILLSDQ